MSRNERPLDGKSLTGVLAVGDRSDGLYDRAKITGPSTIAAYSRFTGTSEDDALLGTNGDDKIKSKDGHDHVYGKRGADLLVGGGGDDVLIGGQGNDLLYGSAGNDSLDGGSGRDKMFGSKGDDIYLIDNKNDEVIEERNSGHDLIGTYISTTIPSWVEDVICNGSASINILGNSLNNLIVANSGANVISGGLGSDFILGKAGNDTLLGNGGQDVLVGSAGDDDLRGGRGNDILDGKAGNDKLNGGLGNDVLFGGVGGNTLSGGAGRDSFVLEFEGHQFDTITDFQTGQEGDRLLLAEDVLDLQLIKPILDEYVRVESTSDSTTVKIDPDGGGNSFIVIARLDNVAGLSANSLVVADDGGLMIVPTS